MSVWPQHLHVRTAEADAAPYWCKEFMRGKYTAPRYIVGSEYAIVFMNSNKYLCKYLLTDICEGRPKKEKNVRRLLTDGPQQEWINIHQKIFLILKKIEIQKYSLDYALLKNLSPSTKCVPAVILRNHSF